MIDESCQGRPAGPSGLAEPTRVLLVLRHAGTALLIGEMLRTSWVGPLALTHADRIEDATQQLVEGSVSAILLDHVGAERLSVIERARTLGFDVPIVVLADDYDDGAALVAIRAGAQDFLARPHLTPLSLRRSLLHAIERKRSEVRLAHRAFHDPLTGLPHRTLFLDRLGVALDRARRTGRVVGVLFLDVDHFKHINDTLGHAAGDRVLTALAARLRSTLRPMDTVARYGGDEFTLVFEDLAGEAEVRAIAERVSEAATGPVALDRGVADITVSIGVATARPGMAPEALVREADGAMYRAKGGGGARYELSDDSSRRSAAQRAGLARELEGALERAELRVHYQPRYELGHRARVAGLEALVRWEHPVRGLIPPGEFIGIAEESGLLAEIGEYVLREALGLIARLRETQADLTVSVNVSPRQLADPGLTGACERALRAAGIEPAALCVEIKESAVSRDPEVAIRAAQKLKAAGVTIAVDDFGTGAASLHSLSRLHADVLKIHESVVTELSATDGNRDNGAVVSAAVELGHALGMSVVAEGVETDHQLVELESRGCDHAQGYLLCEPIAEEHLGEILLRHAA
jgi:diguanylate cyclase (GGDEF)-like protein